tara:strand:+ start:840 stop:2297 length:1458 start_codon:yes stop_codon:yes gene_type:complete
MKKQIYFEEETESENGEDQNNNVTDETSPEQQAPESQNKDFSLQDVGGNEEQAMQRFRFFVNSINLILRTIVEKNKKLYAILDNSSLFNLTGNDTSDYDTSDYDEYINYKIEEQSDDLTDKQIERLTIANKLATNYYKDYEGLKTKFDQIKDVLKSVTAEISKDNGGEINKQAVYNFLGSFETASEFEKYKDNVVVGNITLGDLMGSYKALRQNYLQQKKLIKVAKEFLQTDEQPEDVRGFDPRAGGLRVNKEKVKELLTQAEVAKPQSAYDFLRSFAPQTESTEESLIREGLFDTLRNFFASDIPNQDVQEIPYEFKVETLQSLEQFIGYLKGYNEMPDEPEYVPPTEEPAPLKTKDQVLRILLAVPIIVNKEMLENKRALKELFKFDLENIQKVSYQKKVYDFLKESVFEGDVPETAFVGIKGIATDKSALIDKLKVLEPKQLRLIMNTEGVGFAQQESKENLLTRLIKEQLKVLNGKKMVCN